MRIAIVGSGVSGLVVAHHLHDRHEVTIFEADNRIGGHVNTVQVEVDENRYAVDTGFIVCNEHTYPNFLALLGELGVATQPSEMSFSVSDPASGLQYRASNLSTMYSQRRNALRGGFHRMVIDIVRFNRALRAHVRSDDDDPGETLGEFVSRGRYSHQFVDHFLIPFGASIWSADPTTFLDFPVDTYASFVVNHGMVDVRRQPRWRTISGGSATYVEAITAPFRDRIRCDTPVRKIARHPKEGTVELVTDKGAEHFDRVVLANHSNEALALLGDPTTQEREILGAIRYQPNTATLHRDGRFLPSSRRARASWNFHVGAGDGHSPTVTYWMNRLQSIPTPTPILVTLNRHHDIAEDRVFAEFDYHHPVFDKHAIHAQRRRGEIQGSNGTYFAGAYWANGFHEDGVNSALDVVATMEAS